MRRRHTGSRRRSETIGAVRWKLFEMLREAGIPIVGVDHFWMQEGGYRHNHWDLAKWGAIFQTPVAHWEIFSWHTMTACVRNGFTAKYHGPSYVEIHAKAPRKNHHPTPPQGITPGLPPDT